MTGSGLRRYCVLAALLLPLAGFGLWQIGEAAAIHAKAALGQILLERAWSRSAAGEEEARPWPWADTWPVARLVAPDQGEDLIVLADSSGRTLAWGPGLVDPGGPLGDAGRTVISGHRDTHFRFLSTIQAGNALDLHTADGRVRRYRVLATEVAHHRMADLSPYTAAPMLTLVTCYPFDDIWPGGPLRYLVHAQAEENAGPPTPL